jgi:hypothetical protein
MAHFAQISDGIVTNVIVINNDVCGEEYPASEPIGKAFIASLKLEGNWIQTSYNHNFRKQYAGVGFTYDEAADEFVSLSPCPSWVLDSNNNWQPPIPKPEGDFYWDEESLSWLAIPVG